jgi:hypothetical protein
LSGLGEAALELKTPDLLVKNLPIAICSNEYGDLIFGNDKTGKESRAHLRRTLPA